MLQVCDYAYFVAIFPFLNPYLVIDLSKWDENVKDTANRIAEGIA